MEAFMFLATLAALYLPLVEITSRNHEITSRNQEIISKNQHFFRIWMQIINFETQDLDTLDDWKWLTQWPTTRPKLWLTPWTTPWPNDWSPDDYLDHEENVSSKSWCLSSFALLRCLLKNAGLNLFKPRELLRRQGQILCEGTESHPGHPDIYCRC